MKARHFKLLHFLAGILLILQGLDRLEIDHAHPLFFIVFGAAVGSVGLFHDSLVKNYQVTAAMIYWLEALMILFIAFHYFEIGKKYLPILYIGLVIYYIFIGLQVQNPRVKKVKR